MGIIIRQAGLSSLYTYVGHAIGFLNFAILMNWWLTPDEMGLRGVLLSVSLIVIQFAHLGSFRSLVKFFPFFNKDGKQDNGLLGIGLLISLIGFLLLSAVLLLFKNAIIVSFSDQTNLFKTYYWLIFPISFFLLYSRLFESYLQARSHIALSAFLKNVLHRLLVSVLLVFLFYKILDFFWFITIFSFLHLSSIIVFIIYLLRRGEFNIDINWKFFNKRFRKVFYNFSAYSIVSNVSAGLINKIDALMIFYFLTLSDTAIYYNALFISTLVSIPSNAINQIAMPLLSHSWKNREMGEMLDIYKKSSINQLLMGGILFILILSSIDNLFELQREIYRDGKFVFIILGLSKIISMLFGVNGQILKISKYFRFDTYLSIGLVFVTIFTNYLLIPIWGVEGAAMATAISVVLFNLVRSIYVHHKMRLQPFTKNTVIAILLLFTLTIIGVYLPFQVNIYIDTLIRSLVLFTLAVAGIYYLKISPDLNDLMLKLKKRLYSK